MLYIYLKLCFLTYFITGDGCCNGRKMLYFSKWINYLHIWEHVLASVICEPDEIHFSWQTTKSNGIFLVHQKIKSTNSERKHCDYSTWALVDCYTMIFFAAESVSALLASTRSRHRKQKLFSSLPWRLTAAQRTWGLWVRDWVHSNFCSKTDLKSANIPIAQANYFQLKFQY